MSASKKFSSNGKLLISAEYLVLDGALALAVPLNHAHILNIEYLDGENELFWESFDIHEKYFSAVFNLKDLSTIRSNNTKSENFIRSLLLEAKRINPGFLPDNKSIRVHSHIAFSRHWGWGSSSTTISNIAKWAEIDPFRLFFTHQNGSGYDIACALSAQPIIYQLRKNQPYYHDVNLFSTLTENAFFIFTGKKADTKSVVSEYIKTSKLKTEDIEKISALTKQLVNSKYLKDLILLIEKHESIISELTGLSPIKDEMFSDFDGAIKSLGAWGGDFIMAVSEKGHSYVSKYFNNKKMNPIFGYNEIVL